MAKPQDFITTRLRQRRFHPLWCHRQLEESHANGIKHGIGDNGAHVDNGRLASTVRCGASVSQWAEENARIREDDRTLWSKVKKEMKRQLEESGEYVEDARENIARRMGGLLSYSEEKINSLLSSEDGS